MKSANCMKAMDTKAQSRSDGLPGDFNFYGCLSEFLVKNGKVKDISGLVEVVIESLPRILPISYVSIFRIRADILLDPPPGGNSSDRGR